MSTAEQILYHNEFHIEIEEVPSINQNKRKK